MGLSKKARITHPEWTGLSWFLSIRGLNLSTVHESLRGIIPVYDHPGLLLISVKVITKIKASFPGVAQFI